MSCKLFGFGVLVVLSGLSGVGVCLTAACSDDYESRTIEPLEGGAPLEGGGGGDATPAQTCPTSTPVDPAKLGWKPPTPPQDGKCQDDDIVAMREYLANEPKATNEDFLAFVKNRDQLCAECVFANADLATWPPAPVKSGKVVTFNVGACYAVVTGREECGRAFQNAWDCEFDACIECTSANALEACRTKARTTTCKEYDDKTRTECVGLASSDSRCGGPFDSIRVQCQSSTPDAGKL